VILWVWIDSWKGFVCWLPSPTATLTSHFFTSSFYPTAVGCLGFFPFGKAFSWLPRWPYGLEDGFANSFDSEWCSGVTHLSTVYVNRAAMLSPWPYWYGLWRTIIWRNASMNWDWFSINKTSQHITNSNTSTYSINCRIFQKIN